MSEHDEQAALIRFCRLIEPRVPDLAWLLHVPNGDLRDARVARRLKDAGVRAGVWDLFLPARRNDQAGIWIEMKTPAGRLSAEQRAFAAHLAQQHCYTLRVCRSWPEAARAILDYLGERAEDYGVPGQ